HFWDVSGFFPENAGSPNQMSMPKAPIPGKGFVKSRSTFVSQPGGEVILSRYKKANSLSTIDFIKHLQRRSEGAKIVLVWDGASYHRSQEFRDFLAQVNTDKQWNIHCLRFAPYAPSENPIENIWGQAKKVLQQMHQRCRSFKLTKKLFELFIEYRLFTMPNLGSYEAFSIII
ncbi:transposase, partial [Moorena sp. SIO4E2]|uniref:transposase n=1 Tax=Moorena sp. SIO4E2 TaxID=2607826 RepID=UPI00257988A3